MNAFPSQSLSDNLKSKIKNRKLVGLVALAVTLVALAGGASAQQPKKVLRIGYLSSIDAATDSTRSEPFRQALRDLGYIEGQNIATEYRYSEGKQDRDPELAAELVRLKVDLIVVSGGEGTIRAAMNATKMIPIVMNGGGIDPVEAGLVESLARPDGNVTGITTLSRELAGSVWSCSRKPFRKLLVSRFSTGRRLWPLHAM